MELKGFLRLSQALKLIPVGKSYWYEGVKAGRFPTPIKMGKVALYKVENIEKVIKDIKEINQQQADTELLE